MHFIKKNYFLHICIVVFCCFILIFTQNFTIVNAADNSENSSIIDASKLYARYAAIIDADSNRLLFGKNEDTPVPMASTTKIMTCIIALEYCDTDFLCTTSNYAASMPDVQLNATRGEIFNINDLLYSLMLKSHNDTAVIIAENTAYNYICNLSSGVLNDKYDILSSNLPDFLSDHLNKDSLFLNSISTEQSQQLVHIFAKLMNEKAKELDCNNTHFITPNGLDSADEEGIHSTTANDLAKIMSYCIHNNEFLKITQTKEYSFTSVIKKENSQNTLEHNLTETKPGNSYSVTNSNAFLNMYDNIISGKTGFTGDAGYCYVCAYQCDGRTFIVTLLACGWPNNKTYKWHDAKLLLNWARNNYFYQKIISAQTPVKDISVSNGLTDYIHLRIEDEYGLLLNTNDTINVIYKIPDSIKAPINEGDIIGYAYVYINDSPSAQIPVYSCNTVKETTFAYFFNKLFHMFLLL